MHFGNNMYIKLWYKIEKGGNKEKLTVVFILRQLGESSNRATE